MQREERERLLEQIIAGELADDAPEVLAGERGDPELRAALDELRQLQDELDATGLRERVLQDARQSSWPTAEDRMQSLVSLEASRRRLDRQREDDSSPRPRPFLKRSGPRWILGLAALAAALALIVDANWGGSAPIDDQEPRVFLGPELEGAAPAGPSHTYTPFRWSYAAPAGTTFEIRVFDAETEALLAESGRLREPGWEPDSNAWPDRIRWTLEVTQGEVVLERWSVRAWRRSP